MNFFSEYSEGFEKYSLFQILYLIIVYILLFVGVGSSALLSQQLLIDHYERYIIFQKEVEKERRKDSQKPAIAMQEVGEHEANNDNTSANNSNNSNNLLNIYNEQNHHNDNDNNNNENNNENVINTNTDGNNNNDNIININNENNNNDNNKYIFIEIVTKPIKKILKSEIDFYILFDGTEEEIDIKEIEIKEQFTIFEKGEINNKGKLFDSWLFLELIKSNYYL
jgi:hypothetical protein